MFKPILIGLLSSSFLIPAFANSEEALTTDNKVRAIVILDNPQTLTDLVDSSILERVNPLPNAEKPESTPSGPLATEDTGTPGKHGIEVNVIGNCDRSRNGRSCESVVGVAYGIRDNIELSFEKSAFRETGFGEANFSGAGQTEIGMKYRFFDKKGFSMAIAPSYSFNDASKRRDEDGNIEKGEGSSVYIPLIISKEMGAYTTVANIGYRRNLQNRSQDSIITSLAVGRSINETNRVMAEVYSERDTHMGNVRTDVRVGWVKLVFPDKLKNFETSVYTSVARTLGHTEDGRPHTTVNFGISIARKAH